MDSNIILTDADGVLLNWEWAFDCWMNEHGFKKQKGTEFAYSIGTRYGIDEAQGKKLIKIFNESAAIGFLPPLRDAIHYVKKLHEEHGYVFHCITSLSKNKNAQRLRKMNLEKLFGETVFEEIVCLGTGADKDDALEPYRDSGLWFIEDKIENAETAERMGINGMLVEHGHNMNHETNIPIVKNWKEIYEIIIGR
jgi:FMN phosphatase YigB (HAD superfamily)